MQTFQIQCSDSWMFPKFCAYPFHIFIPSVAPWLFAAMNVLSLSIKNTGLHSKFRVSGSDSCGISGQLPDKKKDQRDQVKPKQPTVFFCITKEIEVFQRVVFVYCVDYLFCPSLSESVAYLDHRERKRMINQNSGTVLQRSRCRSTVFSFIIFAIWSMACGPISQPVWDQESSKTGKNKNNQKQTRNVKRCQSSVHQEGVTNRICPFCLDNVVCSKFVFQTHKDKCVSNVEQDIFRVIRLVSFLSPSLISQAPTLSIWIAAY